MFWKIVKMDNIPEKLFSLGEKVFFKKDDIVFHEDDTSDCMYILIKGRIMSFSINESGSIYYYFMLVEPCIFGEEFAIRQKEIGASFKCLMDSELIRISRKELLDIMKTNFDITMYLYNLNTERFIHSSIQTYRHATESSEDRIIEVLLEFAEVFGKNVDNKIKINYKLTQQFISELIGVKRLTTSRILNKFKSDGIIDFIDGNYYINNIYFLKKLNK